MYNSIINFLGITPIPEFEIVYHIFSFVIAFYLVDMMVRLFFTIGRARGR